jgi:hypothetical protein
VDEWRRQQGSPTAQRDQRIHGVGNYQICREESAQAKGGKVKLEGKIWKDEKTKRWVVHVPLLDISTQGKTRSDALAMIEDAVEVEASVRGLKIHAELSREPGTFKIGANDPDRLIAFLLKRQRAFHGLSVREVATRLKSSSPTAYAQYEQGKRAPSLGKLQDLLRAIDPNFDAVLRAG